VTPSAGVVQAFDNSRSNEELGFGIAMFGYATAFPDCRKPEI